MVAIDTEAILERRDYFPRGLIQPQDGYRTSLDSMLLACFAHTTRGHTGIDLGSGCGVIGLGLLLRQPNLKLTGVEIDAQAVISAEENIVNFHFGDRFSVVEGDVATWRPESVVDFVVANPPYRELKRHRPSVDEDRRTARFETQGDFVQFARCAALALKTRGKFTFVHLAERLPELMVGLSAAGLEPKRMRLVHGRANEGAKMVLMETVKAGGVGLLVEAPLILHEGQGKETKITDEAKEFCPFMGRLR